MAIISGKEVVRISGTRKITHGALSFPLGQAFLWRFKSRKSGSLWQRIIGKPAPAVEIVITVPGVQRLVGMLSDFVVETVSSWIICGRHVRIAPLPSRTIVDLLEGLRSQDGE